MFTLRKMKWKGKALKRRDTPSMNGYPEYR
jgi:hypothetical protein